jgi:hypothetical protein
VSTSQPAILQTMLKMLETDKKKGKNNRPVDQKASYAGIYHTSRFLLLPKAFVHRFGYKCW